MEGFAHSLIEPFEELGQGFAFAANQHGQALMGIVCNGDTAHRPDHADSDLAMPDQFSDVGQGWETSHGLVYAARSRFFGVRSINPIL